ncbi:MAG TPA: CARDB domain-containing protein [Clostridia bacterium]
MSKKKLIILPVVFVMLVSLVLQSSALTLSSSKSWSSVFGTVKVFMLNKPDLVITNMTITPENDTVSDYSCTIKNNGNATISDLYDVTIQNYFTPSTTSTSGDKPAGGRIIGDRKSLASGESYTFTFRAAYGKAPSGYNYVRSVIDYGNLIAESNESNNTFVTSIPTVDLIITAMSVTPITSTSAQYSYTIKNNGSATIASLYNAGIQNYYSANTIYADAGDVAAGGRIIGVKQSLAPGQSYTLTYTMAHNAVPSGMNYLTAKVDLGSINSVIESNNSNNTFAIAIPASF